jgi:hypothetical protein
MCSLLPLQPFKEEDAFWFGRLPLAQNTMQQLHQEYKHEADSLPFGSLIQDVLSRFTMSHDMTDELYLLHTHPIPTSLHCDTIDYNLYT